MTIFNLHKGQYFNPMFPISDTTYYDCMKWKIFVTSKCDKGDI